MYALCESMEWNHLPVAGGLYAQDPSLLDDFYTIWEVKSKIEKQKRLKEEQELRRARAQQGRPASRRGRRR